MELCGQSPLAPQTITIVIFEDANIENAARAAVIENFFTQMCVP